MLDGVIVPTLPYDLPKHSNVPTQDIEFWTSILLAAYGLAAIVAAPILGLLANHTSNRKIPLLAGLLMQIASTVLYGALHDVRALVAARFLQGLSAAMVYTSGLAYLVDSVESNTIGYYIGTAFSAENIGLLVSPIIGGPVYQKLGRSALIGLMLALVGVDVLLRLLITEPRSSVQQDPRLTAGSEDGHNQSLQAPESAVPSDDVGMDHPLTLLQLLKNPRVLTAAYGLFLGQIFLTTFDGVLPRFAQLTYDWDASAAGLVFLTLSVPSLLAFLAGDAADKYGPKWIAVCGFAVAAPAFVILLPAQGKNLANEVTLCIALAVIGLAVAFITSPLASDLAIVVENQNSVMPGTEAKGDNGYGQVFSISLFAQTSGIVIGPMWGGLAYHRLSWTFMSLSLTVLAASALPLCVSSFCSHVDLANDATVAVHWRPATAQVRRRHSRDLSRGSSEG